jgi:hypothetical protein
LRAAVGNLAGFQRRDKEQTRQSLCESNVSFRLGTSQVSDSDSTQALGTLGSALFGAFFCVHVLELAGLEDLAALQALNKFPVFIPRDDLHTLVRAATLCFRFLVGSARVWR